LVQLEEVHSFAHGQAGLLKFLREAKGISRPATHLDHTTTNIAEN
jgi:hypothetical protein